MPYQNLSGPHLWFQKRKHLNVLESIRIRLGAGSPSEDLNTSNAIKIYMSQYRNLKSGSLLAAPRRISDRNGPGSTAIG